MLDLRKDRIYFVKFLRSKRGFYGVLNISTVKQGVGLNGLK